MNTSPSTTYNIPSSTMPKTPALRYQVLEFTSKKLQQSGNGWLFVGSNEAASARTWWIFFIIATISAAAGMVWMWVAIFLPLIQFSGFDIGNLIFTLGTAAGMWGLLAGLGWSKRRYERIKIFEPARIMLIDRVYGADTVIPVIFRRNLKRASLPAPAEVFARLSCFELSERRVGTTVEYDQALLWQSEPVASFTMKGATCIDADLELRTPVSPTASTYRSRWSLSSRKQNVSWVIEVYQSVDKFKSHLIIPIEVQAPVMPSDTI